ncbi:arsinothricin resistance N-acetyltransferase ArsN1 family B [Marinomonas mediterranea]|jgi:Sortase and related acyltransferases|uniref:Phosphinothricin acetyltransferase n=1 Tax=Marinomonas mediterranea (strain ATCC 700492 / JCM 21426 / NBRC 103028 / MMB-1) TaxID=717774 RepID=F2JVJ4_MARM1|nr:arsinothricin resistance N-acetyltransferase ArsN1 family B [Marinomonas mediterranea]ADZ90538.1 Phosphinothricin acetyltransferase [Marinomonas mediterranea MMB-1]WCN16715.1 GNAT family N-acetyltransferase [Marinomonas mediterranea MMB-1]
MIRNATPQDAAKIAAIYNHYIVKTSITFEEEPVSIIDIVERVQKVQGKDLPWLVAEVDGEIAGYAYAAHWHNRSAYRFSVEASVYLSPCYSGKGLGTALYQALFDALKKTDVHTVIGCLALPNEASVALHNKFDMKKIGHFEQVGFKFGQWWDVGYWQLTLDD